MLELSIIRFVHLSPRKNKMFEKLLLRLWVEAVWYWLVRCSEVHLFKCSTFTQTDAEDRRRWRLLGEWPSLIWLHDDRRWSLWHRKSSFWTLSFWFSNNGKDSKSPDKCLFSPTVPFLFHFRFPLTSSMALTTVSALLCCTVINLYHY